MSSEEPERFLAVLKAAYDYEPQSEDEMAIKEDQLLLLVERVDEDWWKVKIKGNSQDSESLIGLVPSAYVEQAEHNSVVKALYEYEAAAPGELSVHEDDVLLVFDTEEDWILVQDKNVEGKAGYVPGNYVEVIDEEAPPQPAQIIVPESPPKPAYVDPADRVASTKATADDIKTWAVSELDKKGKKKKGTLGIGNGAVFFASESDKTPVQKWQTKDVTSVSSEKAKHVEIEIGGSNPISLHFHAGSKDNAEAIIDKLHSSKALTSTPTEVDNSDHLDAKKAATKKPSVHFSGAPTIIPDPPVPDELEPEPEPEPETSQSAGNSANALYDFTADGEDELSVKAGEQLIVLEKDDEDWWKCRNEYGQEGVVPASYLELDPASGLDVNDHKEDEDEDEETKLAEENRRKLEDEDRQQQEIADIERRKKEEAAKARKEEAQRKAKEAALAAEREREARQKKKEQAIARTASPPAQPVPTRKSSSKEESSRQSSEASRPPMEQTRVWHDRTGQFRVEAAYLGFKDGKLRLHKVNGVIVEVPAEKMSLEDLRYVEKVGEKKRQPQRVSSDDDKPLADIKKSQKPPKKAPQIDWFDFFLSAGCDLDDCTRYAASFEKDKMDESLLNDITESTMRSLGLREGDILRVKKAIEKRKPMENLNKPSGRLQDQMKKDEALARELQAQENTGKGGPAPNLFAAGPGGALKQRRGRPTPKTSAPASVDLNAISTASGHIQRTESPRPSSAQLPSANSTLPARPNSAAALTTMSGFEDDAWTNRPSSTKPVKAISPPPASVPAPVVTSPAPPPVPTPPLQAVQTAAPTSITNQNGTPSLANTTEDDILKQLERLSELRKNLAPQQVPQPAPSPSIITPPVGFQSGMGMGPSPSPIGQIANARMVSPPPAPTPPLSYNGPRGPYAPVLANQGLLQPLIPTQTGFNGFVPTKVPTSSPSPFQNNLMPSGFMQPQQTGFQTPSPMMMNPTGYGGGPFAGGVPAFQGQNGSFGSMSNLPLQPQSTGFPMMNTSPFGNQMGMSSPPPLPSNPVKDTTPANIFAQMKSGTFAKDDNQNNGQNNWGQQQQYSGYTGY